MDTPGYDPVAVTGQVAGGCNVICFTTGRGSVSGFKPAPCTKIATNTEMYEHMRFKSLGKRQHANDLKS